MKRGFGRVSGRMAIFRLMIQANKQMTKGNVKMTEQNTEFKNTWSNALSSLILTAVESTKPSDRHYANKQLEKMAKLADLAVECVPGGVVFNDFDRAYSNLIIVRDCISGNRKQAPYYKNNREWQVSQLTKAVQSMRQAFGQLEKGIKD